jgi:ATP-dependent Zn protease
VARWPEELFFGDVSTGPSSDLLYATNIAAQMVGACGMSDTLVSLAGGAEQRVLRHEPGRAGSSVTAPAAAAPRSCCRSRRSRFGGCWRTTSISSSALRDALFDRHELIGHEITDVLEAAKLAGPDYVVDLRGVGSPVLDR